MTFFSRPLQIGTLEVPNRVFLAPLAGVSDVPFRRACQKLGAGLTYVEMLSSVAILYKNKKTFDMMARHKDESILGVQVTGPAAETVAQAISVLDGLGYDTIDINMGCPVKKVVGAGCGSAILKDPSRVRQTAEMARQATSKPLSGKIRLGFTREDYNVDVNAPSLAERTDMCTIHGRTRSEGYSTPVDRSGIAHGIAASRARNPKAVLVANGDIFDHTSAEAMIPTGCDAVMVSRGALGNPWIFREILEGKPSHPTLEEWLDVVSDHMALHAAHYENQRLAAVLARKHLLWYCKGFPGVKALRDALNTTENLDDAVSYIRQWATKQDLRQVRFAHHHMESTDYDPKWEMDRQLDRGVGDEGM